MTLLLNAREVERVEHRVLGALRCVDATTGAPLEQALRVEAPAGARIQRNRSGLLVIRDWQPLAHHAGAFNSAPGDVPLGSLALTFTVSDPLGHYLPRLVRVDLPRDADPANAGQPDSLFRPLTVPMYPSAAGRVGSNWAGLSVSVFELGSGDVLGGVLLRVVVAGAVRARGLSDWRGEALVPVAGIPVTTWSTGPGNVVVTQIQAELQAVADPARVTRHRPATVQLGRAPKVLPLVDPVAIEAASAGLPQASALISLAAGRPLHVSLGVNLP
jgi:hypothetical protein